MKKQPDWDQVKIDAAIAIVAAMWAADKEAFAPGDYRDVAKVAAESADALVIQ